MVATQRALVQDPGRLKIECNWSSRNAVLLEDGGTCEAWGVPEQYQNKPHPLLFLLGVGFVGFKSGG